MCVCVCVMNGTNVSAFIGYACDVEEVAPLWAFDVSKNTFFCFCSHVSSLESEESKPICSARLLNAQQVKTFHYAVSHDYWFQYFIDDLPVWGKLTTNDICKEELKAYDVMADTFGGGVFFFLIDQQ